MHDTRIRIDRSQALPEFLPISRQGIKGGSLMRKVGSSTVFGHPHHVITHVRKGSRFKGSVIVPLRPHTENAVLAIVGEPKNVAIHVRGGRMHAVRTVYFATTPPLTGVEQLVDRQVVLFLEDDKAAVGHFCLEGLTDIFRWRCPWVLLKVQAVHLGADRVEWKDTNAVRFK